MVLKPSFFIGKQISLLVLGVENLHPRQLAPMPLQRAPAAFNTKLGCSPPSRLERDAGGCGEGGFRVLV